MDRLFQTVFFALLIFSWGCSGPGGKQDNPNIIFILADDLGYGDISAFNENCRINTAHIDQLAAEGMIFTDAHTSSSVCSPTRYGIMTGRYSFRSPMKSGVLWGMSDALIPTGRTTVASMLKEKGYHTAFIGKWHLGWNWTLKDTSGYNKHWWDRSFDDIDYGAPVSHTPNDLGFDYAYGHIGSLDMPPYVYVENGRVTAAPDRATGDPDWQRFWRRGPTGADFVHEEVTPHFFEKAMEYIKDRSGKKQPFFLYLPLPSPHTPILPTEEWQGKSGLNIYGDFVLMIDDYIGQLLDVLEKAGIKENTIVFFASDNGCSERADFDLLAEKGHHPGYIFRGQKSDLFEGGHWVPFVVRWPGVVKPGSKSDRIICTVDLMATLAELTGYSIVGDEAGDSFSFLPLLRGKTEDYEERAPVIHHSVDGEFAIRKGDWKLLLCNYSGGWSFPSKNDTAVLDTMPPVQLYHMGNDPGETNNLQKKYPDKVLELKSDMVRIYLEGRSTDGPMLKNDPAMHDNWNQPWFIDE